MESANNSVNGRKSPEDKQVTGGWCGECESMYHEKKEAKKQMIQNKY